MRYYQYHGALTLTSVKLLGFTGLPERLSHFNEHILTRTHTRLVDSYCPARADMTLGPFRWSGKRREGREQIGRGA
jgi:hypothetical protein